MKARTITISRQYGSGGHEVAKKLSEALGLPCYDNEVISLAAKESGAQLWEFQMAKNLRDTNFIYNLSMIAPHSDIRREPYASSLPPQSEARPS
jgi:cytidylate kinase